MQSAFRCSFKTLSMIAVVVVVVCVAAIGAIFHPATYDSITRGLKAESANVKTGLANTVSLKELEGAVFVKSNEPMGNDAWNTWKIYDEQGNLLYTICENSARHVKVLIDGEKARYKRLG